MIKTKSIITKDEFLQFLANFRQDLQDHPEKWENKDLPSFLEAMQAWIEDMDGFYENIDQPCPSNISWEVFVHILNAASIYE